MNIPLDGDKDKRVLVQAASQAKTSRSLRVEPSNVQSSGPLLMPRTLEEYGTPDVRPTLTTLGAMQSLPKYCPELSTDFSTVD